MKSLIIIAAVLALNGMAMAVTPHAPQLINYQGRLTDNVGAPVADGTYSVVFKIWDDATSVNPVDLVWNSGSVSVSTVNGVFSVVLGSSPMPGIDPVDMQDSLRWLGITVGADPELTPRTRMTSVPYALTAERAYSAIEAGTAPNYLPLAGGTMTGNTIHDGVASEWRFGSQPWQQVIPGNVFGIGFGLDGLEQYRIWGGSWGEIMLNDLTGNEMTAYLSANGDNGGYLGLQRPDGTLGATLNAGWPGQTSTLRMYDSTGALRIVLQAAGAGDASAILPDACINATETSSEPGVANTVSSLSTTLSTGVVTRVDSVTITVPTSGYIEVSAGGYVQLSHTNGTPTELYAAVDLSPSVASFMTPGASTHHMPSSAPTGNYLHPVSCSRLFSLAGGTHTIYYNARRASGVSSCFVSQPWVRAKFYPTAYGTIDLSVPARTGDDLNVSATDLSYNPQMTKSVITVEQHNALVAAELAKQRAELEARLAKLEFEMNEMREKHGQSLK